MKGDQSVDPITVAVIAGALQDTIRQMEVTIRRTARSQTVVVGHDLSNTIFAMVDGIPIMVWQGEDQPVHLGVLIIKIKEGIRYFGADIHPGDVIYHNDPATGGNHLPDCTMYKPVFYDGELVALSATTIHMSEIGGAIAGGYNPHAEDLFAEGLRIPHVKISEGGRMREDVWNLILTNVRTPALERGDMGAMYSAITTAEERLLGVFEKYGKETVKECMRLLIARADQAMRAEISSMPDGTYEGAAIMQDTGDGSGDINIHCTIQIKGDEMDIRLQSPPQVRTYANSYAPNTVAATYFALLSAVTPDIPVNEGLYMPVHLDVGPKGTFLNAAPPAPCGMSTGSTFALVFDAVADAFSQAVPMRACAGWARSAGNVLTGTDPRDGETYAWLASLTISGGGGAYHGRDGGHLWGIIAPGGAMMLGDIELHEARLPFHVRRHELAPDSACPGKWRGGLGAHLDIEAQGQETVVEMHGDGTKYPPPSRLSGGSPLDGKLRVHRKWITRGGRNKERLQIHTVKKMQAGDRLLAYLVGGGAVGPAWERDVALVQADVQNGFVSVERARQEYGVILDPVTLEIDAERTKVQRARLAKRR